MKHVAIIVGSLLSLSLGTVNTPAEALTICSTGSSAGFQSTLTLTCSGGSFQSVHHAFNFGGTDKAVDANLNKAPAGFAALASSGGIDVNGVATGSGCTAADNNPSTISKQRSPKGACDGTAHPLARVFGTLSI
jgi:hypothetical protein